jgi:hypothetical protein
VVAVAYQNQRIALLRKLDSFNVYLGDERAGGVNDFEVTALAALADCRRDAMRGVDHALTVWDIVDFMDENCAFFRQLIDNISIMNDLAANIDGCAEGFEGDSDDIDGANDAGAEAAGLEK